MKKVRSPQQIKTKLANRTIRSIKPLTDKIPKIKNKMLNKKALEGKTGGYNLSNYYLDLMKLT